MIETITPNVAAERLGVSVTTVKNWLNQLPTDKEMDSRGRRRIDPRTMEVLATVKELRGEDCGYETIRRRIFQVTDDQKPADNDSVAGESRPTATQPTIDTTAIVSQVIAAIRGENELAEKYARATFTLGQQEERIANLTTQLEEAKRTIAQLEAPKETPAPRPWWKVWG